MPRCCAARFRVPPSIRCGSARSWPRRGHRVIHSEGGPHLLGAFQAAGAIDSLCLTTAPLMAGGDAGRISAGAPGSELHRLALHTLLEEDGNLLAEYRRVAETNGA